MILLFQCAFSLFTFALLQCVLPSLRRIKIDKKTCLETHLELRATNVSVWLQFRWKIVPCSWRGWAETACSVMRSACPLHDHIIIICRPQSSTSCDRVNRDKDIIQVFSSLSSHTVKCHECNLRDNALRHCKPVQCITYCHRDFGGYQRSVLHSIWRVCLMTMYLVAVYVPVSL